MAANQVYLHMHILFCFFCLFFIDIVYFCCFRYFCTNGCVCCFLSHFILLKWNRTVHNHFCLVFFFSSRLRSFLSFLLYTLFGDDLIWICYFIFSGLFRSLYTYMRSVIFHLKCHISSVYG